MTIGSGIAVVGIWAATSVIAWIFKNDVSPIGCIAIMGMAVWATYYLALMK